MTMSGKTKEKRKELSLSDKIKVIKDIYNMDETGLTYHVLPDKTLAIKGEKTVQGMIYGIRVCQPNS